MITKWEIFDDMPMVPRGDRIHATLSYKNVILINGNLHERLGKPEAAVLMFDKVNSVIGLCPAQASLRNAFRLKKAARGQHRLIHATPFCKRFGIKINSTTVFTRPEIDGEGVLRLDLRATTTIRRRAYRPKA